MSEVPQAACDHAVEVVDASDTEHPSMSTEEVERRPKGPVTSPLVVASAVHYRRGDVPIDFDRERWQRQQGLFPVPVVGGALWSATLNDAWTPSPVVFVFGPFKSGTHAMTRYLEKYFCSAVQPNYRDDKGEGLIKFMHPDQFLGQRLPPQRAIWKHTVPMAPQQVNHLQHEKLNPSVFPTILPESVAVPGSFSVAPVVVVLMVREVRHWIRALSEGSYDIFPFPQKTRRQGHRDWLLNGPIELRCPDETRILFANIMELWVCYMYGYLTGGILTESQRLHVCIVRHEDLLVRPCWVLEHLERKGLRRKPGIRFEPLDQGFGGPVEPCRN